MAMSSAPEYANHNRLVLYLANQLKQGRLAVVLGSGVSVPRGLPDWDALLVGMYGKAGLALPDPTDHPVEEIAGHLKAEAFGGDDRSFNEAVRLALYDGVDLGFSALRQDAGLAAIASLAMASRRGSVNNLITFNFDDVLETYLRYHGFVVDSVEGDFNWSSNADVQVLHPHGLLPHDTAISATSSRIVFTRDDFSAVVGDPSNPWNQLALSVMRRNTCLFIGVSGKDNRLHTWLASTNRSHAIRNGTTMYWGVTFSDADDPARRGGWDRSGVWYQVLGGYDELPGFLFEVAQTAATL